MMIDKRAYYLMDAYLNGQLNEQEQLDFEKYSKDPAFLEELEIQKQLYILNSQRIQRTEFSESEEGKQILKGIQEAEENYFQEKSKKGWIRYLSYGVAASILLLVSIFVINFLTKSDTPLDHYYAEYANWDQLPSLTERVDKDNTLAKGAIAFKDEKYDEAINIFTNYLKAQPNNSQVVMYLGASYLKSGNNSLALQTFEHLTKMNTVDRTRGYWYIALVHLKNNDTNQAISALEKIGSDEKNYKFLKAKEILENIKSR